MPALRRAVFFVFAAAMPVAVQAQATSAPPFVESAGTAESRAAPDRATVTLSVESRGPSAAAVAAANARIQRQVLDTLASLGFRAPNVSTRSFNVAPNWIYGPQGRRLSGRDRLPLRAAHLVGIPIERALDGLQGDYGLGVSRPDRQARISGMVVVVRSQLPYWDTWSPMTCCIVSISSVTLRRSARTHRLPGTLPPACPIRMMR